jgi:hypothetical protein
MYEPQHLTILQASMACYGDSFTTHLSRWSQSDYGTTLKFIAVIAANGGNQHTGNAAPCSFSWFQALSESTTSMPAVHLPVLQQRRRPRHNLNQSIWLEEMKKATKALSGPCTFKIHFRRHLAYSPNTTCDQCPSSCFSRIDEYSLHITQNTQNCVWIAGTAV